jgi:hypothetical protein
MKEKRASALERYMQTAGVAGGLSGLINAATGKGLKNSLLAGGIGAALGGGGEALGDALLGESEDQLGAMGHGALGGGILGAGLGVGMAGMHPQGAALAKFIARQRGISPKAAMLALLGGGGIAGSLSGAAQGTGAGTSAQLRGEESGF